MDIKDYIKRAYVIREEKLMTLVELAKELNITYVTFIKLQSSPEQASMKTLRKLKLFVETWEYKNKNMSAVD